MRGIETIKVKHLIAMGFIGVMLYVTINSIRVYDSVFSEPTHVSKLSDWESYLIDRRKRNAKAMKLSYEDLMIIGQELRNEKRWKESVDAFSMAKSIYPSSIDPRIQLCYIYLRLCESEGSYCPYGKREIYYAMQHVKDSDRTSQQYLNKLVDHTDLSDVIALDESAAMNLIF